MTESITDRPSHTTSAKGQCTKAATTIVFRDYRNTRSIGEASGASQMMPAVPASPHGRLTAMVPVQHSVMAQTIRYGLTAGEAVDQLPEQGFHHCTCWFGGVLTARA